MEIHEFKSKGIPVPVGKSLEYDMCRLPELATFEKIKLTNMLLDKAGNAHIDLENGSDTKSAIYYATLAEIVIAELKNEFLFTAI